MSDQGFHEIQLSGKQLVFLFMSLLVLAVVVFLLGVSVGRGVRLAVPNGPPAAVDTAATGDTAAPAQMPPATQTSPNELDFHERLQGRGGDPSKPAEPPQPPPDAPPQTSGAATPASTQQAASKTPAPPAKGGSDPAKTAAGQSTAPQTPPAAGSSAKPAPAGNPTSTANWFAQVEAFRTKELADNLVAKLKGKGYAAFIFNAPAPGIPYHVRIGPFAQRDEAVRTVDRLKKEGFTPSVIR